jgi:hypothetical protein
VNNNKLTAIVRDNNSTSPTAASTHEHTVFSMTGGFQNRWLDIVVKGKVSNNASDNPGLTVWINGEKMGEYAGPVGFLASREEVIKLGVYKWIRSTRSVWDPSVPTREMHVKNSLLIRDAAETYTEAQIRAELNH